MPDVTAQHERPLKVAAVIQARLGSQRLPGKVLMQLGPLTVLEWVVRAAKRSAQIDQVVIATSDSEIDDAIVDVANSIGVDVVRGSEQNVLSRYLLVAESHRPDAIVRLTADCPLLDPELIDVVVGAWRSTPALDYVSTTLIRTLPRGLDVELASVDALRAVALKAVGHDLVHVTSALYAEGSNYRRVGIVVSPPSDQYRVTLDTSDDALLLNAVVKELDDGPYRWQDVVRLLSERPDIVALNASTPQKLLADG